MTLRKGSAAPAGPPPAMTIGGDGGTPPTGPPPANQLSTEALKVSTWPSAIARAGDVSVANKATSAAAARRRRRIVIFSIAGGSSANAEAGRRPCPCDSGAYVDGITGVAADAGAAAAHEVAIPARPGEAGHELEDRGGGFHARERVAEADMGAAEGEMAVRFARDVQSIGLGELRGGRGWRPGST
jgi:hypothetical protein